MYKVKKLKVYDFKGIFNVVKILRECGKDMHQKYGLDHWDNIWIKTYLIVLICMCKNQVYMVIDKRNNPIATFQVKISGDKLFAEKLGVRPSFSGSGVGTFCLDYFESIAKDNKCNKVTFDVFEKSEHAIQFYLNRGYNVCGTEDTLKYKELKMEKEV